MNRSRQQWTGVDSNEKSGDCCMAATSSTPWNSVTDRKWPVVSISKQMTIEKNNCKIVVGSSGGSSRQW